MLPNYVYDRNLCPFGIVQIGETVGEARAKMKERACWLFRHSGITIGRACHYAFKQAEHAAHLIDLIESGDQVHLRRAGVGEASVNAPRQKSPD
jgi:hypothetical protein